jgi:hypothetical protein
MDIRKPHSHDREQTFRFRPLSFRPLCALLGQTDPIRGPPEADIVWAKRQAALEASNPGRAQGPAVLFCSHEQVFLSFVQNDARKRVEITFPRALLKDILSVGKTGLPTLTNA